MKKTAVVLFCLLFLNTVLFAQDEDFYTVGEDSLLEPIDARFFGAYLPMEFLVALEKTKHYDKAMRINTTESYDDFFMLINVYRNRIIHWYYFGEGYSLVTKSELPHYQFEYINGHDIIITDPNGHKYRKITDDAENHASIMSNYIAQVILRDLIAKGEVIIENDTVTIVSLHNKKFKIRTFLYAYNNHENLLLEEIEGNNPFLRIYSLSIEKNVYTLYWIEKYSRPYREVKRVIWERKL